MKLKVFYKANWLICLFLTFLISSTASAYDLPPGVYAVEPGQEPIVLEKVKNGEEIKKDDPVIVNSAKEDRIRHFGLQLGAGSYSGAYGNDPRGSGYLTIGANLRFFLWDKFFTVGRITGLSTSGSRDKKIDYDLRTADNQTIRVVEDNGSAELKEASYDQLFGYEFALPSGLLLDPYFGFGFGQGALETERWLKTDRKVNVPFSTHNRYTLKTRKVYNFQRLILGSNLDFKRIFFFAEVQFRRLKEKSYNQSVGGGDETNYFTDETFEAIPIRNDTALWLGVGVRLF